MRDRLIELLTDIIPKIDNPLRYVIDEIVERIADYLIANGVIVPPCKVGDKVYQTDGVRTYTSTINKIIYDTNSIAFDERAIGKTVFLTKEEAENALKEREK